MNFLDIEITDTERIFCSKYHCIFIDVCHGYKCQHGGTCVVRGGHPKCNCPSAYFGKHCEQKGVYKPLFVIITNKRTHKNYPNVYENAIL